MSTQSTSADDEKLSANADERALPRAMNAKEDDSKMWKIHDEQVLPKNNLPLVFFSLLLATFLSALDQTIVATALPTIVAELQGGQNYSWVGSAYLLASAALSSFYGKLSDLVGRKWVLYPVIVIFLIGSALCGAAQSMTWLIVARAIQGIGGGGIIQMVNIVVGDIVPLEKRGVFGGYAGALWGVASIIGPLVGGALTDHASWRWCFYVNLPTGGVALVLLFFTLHLNPPRHGMTFRQHVAKFDFGGLLLILTGVICVLIGFNQSEISWSSPATISLLVIGGSLLVGAGFWENYTTRSPIIPPRLFRTRTTAATLVTVFIHGFAFFGANYYLPVYFQVLGASATRAGIELLPYSLVSCVVSLVVGFTTAKIAGGVRIIIQASYLIMTLGYGLMIMMDEASSTAIKVIFPMIAGFGVGGLFFPPLLLIQAAMPSKDMATATATLGLLRQLGSTVGIAVGQAIWSTQLRTKLAAIPNIGLDTSSSNLADSIRQIQHLEPASLRQAVQHAYTKSISVIWIVDTPLLGVAFALSLLLKQYSLKRTTAQHDQPQAAADATDLEAGAESGNVSPARTINEVVGEEKQGIAVKEDAEKDVESLRGRDDLVVATPSRP